MEQLSAGKKRDGAFEDLGKKKTLSLELDLDTDVRSLRALDAQSDPAPREEMPDEAAKLISGARIRVTVQSRKPLDESSEKDLVGMAMKISNPDGGLAAQGDRRRCLHAGRHDHRRQNHGTPVPAASDPPPEAGAIKSLISTPTPPPGPPCPDGPPVLPKTTPSPAYAPCTMPPAPR
ncbi:hypothetical protein [Streptomyces sp. NPDC048191]|uniref:hypothetical protein n=1 Tax=Streptomyces sp. NPDC048191 TaxID=3155484 RepID=UPI0033EB6FD1